MRSRSRPLAVGGREQGDDLPRPGRPGRRPRRCWPSRPPDVDLPGFVAYMANYWDLYWALEHEQRALRQAAHGPRPSMATRGAWGIALAGMYEMEGDMRRAAAYGDSARVAFEQQLTATPGGCAAPGAAGAGPGVHGPEGGGDPRGRSAAPRCRRSRTTRSRAPTSSTSSSGSTSWWGSRRRRWTCSSRCSGSLLPLARLAQDRPHLRPAPGQPAVRAVGERELAQLRPRCGHLVGTPTSALESTAEAGLILDLQRQGREVLVTDHEIALH